MAAKIIKIRATAHRPLAVTLDLPAVDKHLRAVIDDWPRLRRKQRRDFAALIHQVADAEKAS